MARYVLALLDHAETSTRPDSSASEAGRRGLKSSGTGGWKHDLLCERLRKDIEWYETFDEHAGLVATLRDALSVITEARAQAGEPRSWPARSGR